MDGLEAEHVSVERDRPLDIAHVEHGMIEAAHGDGCHVYANS
jgi:hypothetical protein